jgi:hypothetical protein
MNVPSFIRNSGRRESFPFFRRLFLIPTHQIHCRCRPRAAMNALLYLPRSARPFRRFIVGLREDDVALLDGVFRFEERDEDKSPAKDRSQLEDAYAWFRGSLKVPPRTVFAEPPGGACWFRSDADDALAAAERLVTILRQLGYPVRSILSDAPGRIVYYDEHQIVTRRPFPGRRRHYHFELPIDQLGRARPNWEPSLNSCRAGGRGSTRRAERCPPANPVQNTSRASFVRAS